VSGVDADCVWIERHCSWFYAGDRVGVPFQHLHWLGSITKTLYINWLVSTAVTLPTSQIKA